MERVERGTRTLYNVTSIDHRGNRRRSLRHFRPGLPSYRRLRYFLYFRPRHCQTVLRSLLVFSAIISSSLLTLFFVDSNFYINWFISLVLLLCTADIFIFLIFRSTMTDFCRCSHCSQLYFLGKSILGIVDDFIKSFQNLELEFSITSSEKLSLRFFPSFITL